MSRSKDYMKIVKWSYEDDRYVGIAPSLFTGGCDGDNEEEVFAELCVIVDEWVEYIEREGSPFPPADPPHIVDVIDLIKGRRGEARKRGLDDAAE